MTDQELSEVGTPQPFPDPATIPIGAPLSGDRRRKERLPRTSLYTAVVGVIVITVLSVACTTLIVLRGGEAPEGLVATSGVGLGALSAFLARGQGAT